MAIGQIVGYVRVSSIDQNTDRQLEGMQLDRVFADKCSGKNTDRPQLTAMLQHVRGGDTLMVHSLDRLGRNLSDLLAMVKDLTGKGVTVKFVKENLTFDGNDSPISNLMLAVMGAVAQFERDLIRGRQAEGIAIAKSKGVYKGRKEKLSPQQASELRESANLPGVNKSHLARTFGISRDTMYRYLEAEDTKQLPVSLGISCET